jgi:hypothetical protein
MRVPPGATIHGALLTVQIVDDGDPGGVYEATVDWDESTTWSTFGPMAGVQPADVGVLVAGAPTAAGAHDIDVTSSLARRSAGVTNQGWVIVPEGGDNGVDCASSEHGETNFRPRLVVEWSMP